jgi:hypothetical protein
MFNKKAWQYYQASYKNKIALLFLGSSCGSWFRGSWFRSSTGRRGSGSGSRCCGRSFFLFQFTGKYN